MGRDVGRDAKFLPELKRANHRALDLSDCVLRCAVFASDSIKADDLSRSFAKFRAQARV